MKNSWQEDLRALEQVQDDLRRRLEELDSQIAALRTRLTETSPGDCPAPESPPVRQVVPPPLPVDHIEPPSAPIPRLERKAEPETPVHAEVPPPPGPPPLPSTPDLELKVGQYWLVRIGILVLLTGLVLLGNLAYHSLIVKLGAAGKLALLYAAGAALGGIGAWLARKSSAVRNYGQVLLAGGAATIYYATYGAHFVAGLRVIENPILGGGALLALAAVLVGVAIRRRSEGVAFTAVLLSYYTSTINPAAHFTLFSNLVLTAAAVFLLARHRWLGVSWLSLAGSYASFAYWRLHSGGPTPDTFWFAHGFLPAYWLIFTGAVFLNRGAAFPRGLREVFYTANNLAFFALFAPAVHAVYPKQFWLFATLFGVILLGLSQLARHLRNDERIFDGVYLVQALFVLTLGWVTRFTGYQLALILMTESTALLFFSKFRHALLLRTAAALAAGGAVLAGLYGFLRAAPYAWLTATFLTALLIFNALLAKRLHGKWPAPDWHWGAAAYAWAGQLMLGVLLADCFSGDRLLWVLAAAAAVAAFSVRLHRLPELAVGAEAYVFSSVLALLPISSASGLDWRNAPPVLAVSLALMHWWPRCGGLSVITRRVWEGIDALAACAVLLLWFSPDWTSAHEMLRLALLGAGVLAYGALTRAVFLAALSQGFTLAAAVLCFQTLAWGEAPWIQTLAVPALIAAQIGVVRHLPAEQRAKLAPLLVAYRLILLALGLAWLFHYTPGSWTFLTLTLCGALVFLPAALRKNPEFLFHAAAFLIAGAGSYVWNLVDGQPGSGGDFLALLVLLAVQQAGKKWLAGTPYFPAVAQTVLAAATLGGMWFQTSRWVWDGSTPVAVTVVWAGLAFAALGAGFLLRERTYRLMGLLILAVAVGHVFLIDVWKFGQLAGILGILGLAVVLLALGFIYNRFAEQIKRWL